MIHVGPKTREQLSRMGKAWKQGEHVLITGGTGSGKTTLARQVIQQRIDRGGSVVVFVGKLTQDQTLTDEYKGWTRWTTFKKNPASWEDKILLWPKVEKIKSIKGKRALQQEVFKEAVDYLANIGKWCVSFDEGYYMAAPAFLNMGDDLAMIHALGRSGKLSLVTLAQRPSHLPLILYSSAAHVFAGRLREAVDRKRLAEIGGVESSTELFREISALGRRQFRWIPVAQDERSEVIDITR